jgi:predicted house-cleaning noncanonical NTP pyrophosphatase (MazG superfamily)
MGKSKLVRDKIPELFNFTNIHTADNEEYSERLLDKLQEEVDEFKEDEHIEELADIVEVINHILKSKGVSMSELEEIRKNKFEERGGFERRIVWSGNERISGDKDED